MCQVLPGGVILVSEDLLRLSYVTLAGTADSVDVLDGYNYQNYDWVAHVVSNAGIASRCRGSAGNVLSNIGEEVSSYVNKGGLRSAIQLLNSIAGPNSTVWANPPRSETIGNRMREYESAPSGKVTYRTLFDLPFNPYLAPDTEFPSDLSSVAMGKLLAVLGAPGLLHVVLYGDTAGARQILGTGLTNIRSIYLDYLGIDLVSTASALSVPVPFTWSEWPTAPSLAQLEFLMTASSTSSDSLEHVRLRAPGILSGIVYDILLSEAMRANKLAIVVDEISKSRTECPFKYPLLVSIGYLVGMGGDKEDPDIHDHVGEVITNSAVQKMYKEVFIDDYSEATKALMPCLQDTLQSIKSAFIALYRVVTAGGGITFPSSNDYPKRSLIAKNMYSKYTVFSEKYSGLLSYVDLATTLHSLVFRLNCKALYRLSCALRSTPFQVLANPEEVDKLCRMDAKFSDYDNSAAFTNIYSLRIVAAVIFGETAPLLMPFIDSSGKQSTAYELGIDYACSAIDATVENYSRLHDCVVAEKIEEALLDYTYETDCADDIVTRLNKKLSITVKTLAPSDTAFGRTVPLKFITTLYSKTGLASCAAIINTVISLLEAHDPLEEVNHQTAIKQAFCAKVMANYLRQILDTGRV